MAAHLTDKQKKKIIADYVQIGSYNAVAKKYGIADTTVKRVVLADPNMLKKAEQKKDENMATVLGHMEKQSTNVCEIIDKTLDILNDVEKLKRSSPQALATAMGILIDKFVCTPLEAEKLKAQTASLRGEDTHFQQQEDDPITKSLKEQFKVT